MIRRRAAILGLLVLLALGPGPAAGALVPGALAPYLAARETGRVGRVEGSAYVEPRRPRQAPHPVEGVIVYLLPHADGLVEALERVKQRVRDDARAYVESGPRLVELREGYERQLLAAGGGELIRAEVSDAAGRFQLTGVPAGRWLLLAWKGTLHPQDARRLRTSDVREFRDNAERLGYVAVAYWRQEVEVRAGEAVEVTLHDRNVWLTAIEERRRVPTEE